MSSGGNLMHAVETWVACGRMPQPRGALREDHVDGYIALPVRAGLVTADCAA